MAEQGVGGGLRWLRWRGFGLQQPGDATLQGLQFLAPPGLEQMATTILGDQSGAAGDSPAQLQPGLAQGERFHITGLQQGGQTGEEIALLHHKAIAQQPGKVQLAQFQTQIFAPIDRLQPPGGQVVLFDLSDRGPKQTVVAQDKILLLGQP